jgi:hypothetical protein
LQGLRQQLAKAGWAVAVWVVAEAVGVVAEVARVAAEAAKEV